MYIAIEGGDGSGKTSLRKHLFQTFRAMELDALAIPPNSWLVPEWTHTIVSAKYHHEHNVPLRDITRAYIGDKEALTREIVDSHYPYRHVVVDRFILSDMVYHHVLYGIDPIHTYRMFEASRVRWPDLTIFVRTDAEVAQSRKLLRDSGGWHRWDELDRQKVILGLYDELLADGSLSRLHPTIVIDNNGSQARTFAEVRSAVLPRVTGAVAAASGALTTLDPGSDGPPS
jgi:dTMP kinase